jgi:hypothetical protein
MRSWLAFLLVTTACGFPMPADVGDDAMPDADSDLPLDAAACYGSFVRVCFSTPPTTLVALTDDTDIDTDASPICDQRNDQMAHYCVVVGAGFTSTKKITAHGSKPLILLSTTTIILAGDVDVSSNHNGTQPRGAGANPLSCTGSTSATGTSGAYGGSFGGKGGDGEPTDGTKGIAAPALASFPINLRGGCPGGAGSPAGAGGAGGGGGGAAAIIAGEIRLDGRINASGAGGRGGAASKSGGGGGGSGGMIVLDAPSIILGTNGLLFANGGGGAQGGTGVDPGSGTGADGGESTGPYAMGRRGADGNKAGGKGGDGSAGIGVVGETPQAVAQPNGGGGAGGGGAGFVHAPGVLATAVAPPPLDLP